MILGFLMNAIYLDEYYLNYHFYNLYIFEMTFNHLKLFAKSFKALFVRTNILTKFLFLISLYVFIYEAIQSASFSIYRIFKHDNIIFNSYVNISSI